MNETPERPLAAASVPMDTGGNPSFAVAAPVGGGVSRKDRLRAGRTALRRDGTTLALVTALPGGVLLQRRGADGAWETVTRRRASRLRACRLELPAAGTAQAASYRVVFAPRNENIPSWVSAEISG